MVETFSVPHSWLVIGLRLRLCVRTHALLGILKAFCRLLGVSVIVRGLVPLGSFRDLQLSPGTLASHHGVPGTSVFVHSLHCWALPFCKPVGLFVVVLDIFLLFL